MSKLTMMQTVEGMIELTAQGRPSTLIGIGPMSPNLLQATFELARDCDFPPMFIASRNQVDLDELTVEQAREYADAGQFGKGSMEPKVRAAIRFCEGRPDRVAIIGSLEKAPEAVKGLSGTRIHY